MGIYCKKASFIFLCCLISVFLTTTVFGQNMFRKINDFDGDGKADFAVTRNEGGNKIWYVWQTTGGFTAYQWGLATDENAAGDYDGDGKTDPGIFERGRPPKLDALFFLGQPESTGCYEPHFTSNKCLSQ